MKDSLKELLLAAPPTQLCPSTFELIKTWPDEPELPDSLQILELLDKCIAGGLASGFVIVVLQTDYKLACMRDGTTHELNVELATWRK